MKNRLFFSKYSFFLLLILIIGTYLRFNNLTHDSFWLDELFSMDFSNPNKSFVEMLRVTVEDVHPPFYQSLLWIWLKLFGFTEFSARSLSALIGILTVLVSYYFSKTFFKKDIALVISFIFSINIFLINFSQEVRSYQLTVLLSILSYLYLYRMLIVKDRKNLYMYWFFTIIWMYTHYYSFFIILAQFIFIIIFYIFFEKNKAHLLKIIITTFILFIFAISPLIPYILQTLNGDKVALLSDKPSITYFISYIHFYFGYGGLYFVLFGFLCTLHYLLTKKIEQREKIILLLLFTWFTLGYLLPYLKSLFSFPLTKARYFIVMIPPIILLSVYGISKQKSLFQFIFLFLFSLFSYKVIFIDFGNKVNKRQYRETINYISQHKNIPIYELIPVNGHRGNNTNHFQVYSDILKLNLNINNDTKFVEDYKNDSLPECFWTIYSFYSPKLKNVNDILKIYNVTNDKSLNFLYNKKFIGAEASLFSKKEKEEKCLNKFREKD